jgi:hypothetical protein
MARGRRRGPPKAFSHRVKYLSWRPKDILSQLARTIVMQGLAHLFWFIVRIVVL